MLGPKSTVVILSSEVSISFRWLAAALATPCPGKSSTPGLALFRFRSEKFTARISPKTKKPGSAVGRINRSSDAIVKGIRRDGSNIIPVMPYQAYSGMAEEDLKALIAYLKTLKPVKKATPELESRAPLTRSLGIPTYLKIFGRFSNSPAQAPKSGIERGNICGACFSLWRLSYAEKFHRCAKSVALPRWRGSQN